MAKEDFKETSADVVEFVKKVEKDFNMPIDIKFQFLSNEKQKKMIKFIKIQDQYASEHAMNADILVIINEDYYDNFDDNTKKLLIEKEYDRIEFNFEKGTFKLTTPTVSVNSGFVAKHSWEKVDNAVKLEQEFEKQKNDKNKTQ